MNKTEKLARILNTIITDDSIRYIRDNNGNKTNEATISRQQLRRIITSQLLITDRATVYSWFDILEGLKFIELRPKIEGMFYNHAYTPNDTSAYDVNIEKINEFLNRQNSTKEVMVNAIQ